MEELDGLGQVVDHELLDLGQQALVGYHPVHDLDGGELQLVDLPCHGVVPEGLVQPPHGQDRPVLFLHHLFTGIDDIPGISAPGSIVGAGEAVQDIFAVAVVIVFGNKKDPGT